MSRTVEGWSVEDISLVGAMVSRLQRDGEGVLRANDLGIKDSRGRPSAKQVLVTDTVRLLRPTHLSPRSLFPVTIDAFYSSCLYLAEVNRAFPILHGVVARDLLSGHEDAGDGDPKADQHHRGDLSDFCGASCTRPASP